MAEEVRVVALLRGINVGGSRKVPMADLRRVVEGVGCEDVATYIQSGNVVCRSSRGVDALREELERAIEAAFGFRVLLVMRTAKDLQDVIGGNPFPEARGDTDLHVVFLAEEPAPGHLDAIDREAFVPDRFALRGRELYLYLPNGMGRSKLAEALAKLPGTATARNWRTVTKLAEMATQAT